MAQRDTSGRDTKIVTCVSCGNTFAAQIFSNSDSVITGKSGCPECGSDDFSVITAEDLGME